MAITVIAVAEGTLVRAGMASVLGGQSDLQLGGVAADIGEARLLIERLRPAVVLLDIHVGGDAVGYGAWLRQNHPHPGVVLVGADDDHLLFRALDAGLSAYVPQTAPVNVLLAAVRYAAAAPSSFTAPQIAAAMARRRRGQTAALSPRERDVLRLIGDGVPTSAIALTLQVSDSTVKTYLARLYDKLGVHGRSQAVLVAAERGLLD
ncbi:response regulator transcription factor [Phytohabitans rumicis]|uniref:DNA-binding response regulator n=1 Tax=Phytohabitans rumicis TaxID=1076125 RepID=A0A6V8KZW0_9ACTN|nr:response regulator transcription factor [Phytohabitans rumicis]GFJ90632.1 DNA-binding response regulator [Phytohabitans rumicis]